MLTQKDFKVGLLIVFDAAIPEVANFLTNYVGSKFKDQIGELISVTKYNDWHIWWPGLNKFEDYQSKYFNKVNSND